MKAGQPKGNESDMPTADHLACSGPRAVRSGVDAGITGYTGVGVVV